MSFLMDKIKGIASDSMVEIPLICPKCGCEETHIERVRVRQNDLLTIVRGPKVQKTAQSRATAESVEREQNWTRTRTRVSRTTHVTARGRGSSVFIDLNCETGCRFSASYSFHKGYVTVEMLDRGRFEPGQEFPGELWRD